MAIIVVTCDSEDEFLNMETLDEACAHLCAPLSHLRFKVRDMDLPVNWTDISFEFDDITKNEIRDCLSMIPGAFDVYYWRHFQSDINFDGDDVFELDFTPPKDEIEIPF